MTYANKIISDSSEINNLLTAHDNFVKSKNYNLDEITEEGIAKNYYDRPIDVHPPAAKAK